MPGLGNLQQHPLVGQCVVWCQAKRLEPLKPTERSFLLLAIYAYEGRFADLNTRQRQMIAGAARG